jgi:hypothetical protein
VYPLVDLYAPPDTGVGAEDVAVAILPPRAPFEEEGMVAKW